MLYPVTRWCTFQPEVRSRILTKVPTHLLQLHVLEVKGRKIRLTQKSAEQRQADQRMEQKGVGSQGSKKASGTMEAALAQLGFKSTPKNTVSNAFHCLSCA